MTDYTSLQKERIAYRPKLPGLFKDIAKLKLISVSERKGSQNEALKTYFPRTHSQPKLYFESGEARSREPLRIGVVLSGGQAAGGHNVITGIFDALKILHPQSLLFGFLDGPYGIVNNAYIPLTADLLNTYRNQGGFDMIGAGRTKIETPEQFEAAAKTASEHKLDGMVIIGGDDSNTNAALLAEDFLARNLSTCVVGVPKTIDGDLKNEEIEVSFGFDTAAKTFSETVGNILRDSLSAKKYYFFIKLMGRSASHLALECALQTQPNMTLIGEEIAKKNFSFKELTNQMCDLICKRADRGKDYGVVLIPEGVIEFIPELNQLIAELNRSASVDALSPEAKACFESLPVEIQNQLLLDRDPHGNVQVSKIETERLFIQSVEKQLKERKAKGSYKGKFSAQPLFCGYEGRSCFPTNFDAQYCYSLGYCAALLIADSKTGYLASIQNLTKPVEKWRPAGIPLADMIHLEERKGKLKPVIKKALVDLEGRPFKFFEQNRGKWALDDHYRYPGPIQYFGPEEITEAVTLTLRYERS